VNPLATWTDLDVDGYVRDRELPVHPLADRGYVSIGCWPCTAPVQDGDDPRRGRWAGSDKTECGLHD
jgi:phosphoadenosine phosphosulfate reductase